MLEAALKNWPLKLLALGLAFGIWVSVTGETAIVQDYNPPLDIRVPEGSILASTPPTNVTIRLRGTQTSLRKVDALGLSVSVVLRDGVVGERDIPLGESNLTGVPRGVQLEFVSPDRLTLTVDRRVQKRLPVEPTFLGMPPDGYTFYGAETRPSELLVEGPESEVQSLEVLRTNPIRLDDFTRPVSRRVSTVPDSPHVRVVGAERLQVRVIVDATPVERVFEQVAVEVTGARFETTVEPTHVTVTLSGPPALLNQIAPESLRVRADGTGLAPRDEPYDLDLELLRNGAPMDDPDRISIKAMSRNKVRVHVLDRSVSL
jgi:YbbR domain-containing protein